MLLRYIGKWDNADPDRHKDLRILRFSKFSSHIDNNIVNEAAMVVGLEIEEILMYLPGDFFPNSNQSQSFTLSFLAHLIIFVNPGEVFYVAGDDPLSTKNLIYRGDEKFSVGDVPFALVHPRECGFENLTIVRLLYCFAQRLIVCFLASRFSGFSLRYQSAIVHRRNLFADSFWIVAQASGLGSFASIAEEYYC